MVLQSRLSLVLASVLGLAGACERSAVPVPTAVDEQPAGAPYVGAWAEQPQLCGRSEWRITPETIESDSGQACVLRAHRPAAAGWSAIATCANGAFGAVTLRTAAGPPESLVITGEAWTQPVSLVRCPAGPDRPARDPYGLLDMAALVDLKIARAEPDLVAKTTLPGALVRTVWRRGDHILKLVEPVIASRGDGGRAFYFLEGKVQPFLIRGPQGAYGFADGRLVARFTPQGVRQSIPESERGQLERTLLRDAARLREIAAAGLDDPAATADRPDSSADSSERAGT